MDTEDDVGGGAALDDDATLDVDGVEVVATPDSTKAFRTTRSISMTAGLVVVAAEEEDDEVGGGALMLPSATDV